MNRIKKGKNDIVKQYNLIYMSPLYFFYLFVLVGLERLTKSKYQLNDL